MIVRCPKNMGEKPAGLIVVDLQLEKERRAIASKTDRIPGERLFLRRYGAIFKLTERALDAGLPFVLVRYTGIANPLDTKLARMVGEKSVVEKDYYDGFDFSPHKFKRAPLTDKLIEKGLMPDKENPPLLLIGGFHADACVVYTVRGGIRIGYKFATSWRVLIGGTIAPEYSDGPKQDMKNRETARWYYQTMPGIEVMPFENLLGLVGAKAEPGNRA